MTQINIFGILRRRSISPLGKQSSMRIQWPFFEVLGVKISSKLFILPPQSQFKLC